MKRLCTVLAICGALAVAGGVEAQTTGQVVTVTGTIVASASSNTFTIALPNGNRVLINAGGAMFNAPGGFADSTLIRPGARVTIAGTFNGATLFAGNVSILSSPNVPNGNLLRSNPFGISNINSLMPQSFVMPGLVGSSGLSNGSVGVGNSGFVNNAGFAGSSILSGAANQAVLFANGNGINTMANTTSVVGTVVSAASSNSFNVRLQDGSRVVVMASGAGFSSPSGFFDLSQIRPGTLLTLTGFLNGNVMQATEVQLGNALLGTTAQNGITVNHINRAAVANNNNTIVRPFVQPNVSANAAGNVSSSDIVRQWQYPGQSQVVGPYIAPRFGPVVQPTINSDIVRQWQGGFVNNSPMMRSMSMPRAPMVLRR